MPPREVRTFWQEEWAQGAIDYPSHVRCGIGKRQGRCRSPRCNRVSEPLVASLPGQQAEDPHSEARFSVSGAQEPGGAAHRDFPAVSHGANTLHET